MNDHEILNLMNHISLLFLYLKKNIISLPLLILSFSISCKTRVDKIMVPDLRPNFLALLHQRDSALSLDSFYFIGIDTMNAKKALIHQRYAFLHIMERINGQLNSIDKRGDKIHQSLTANDQESRNYLQEEKTYVGKEIDSFNLLIEHADSTAPVGFRAFYKVTVSKKPSFTISDTIPYSITMNMQVSDWDRNIEKNIDSLAIGRHGHPGVTK